MEIRDFRDLNIWKRSIALVEEIYKVTKQFPKEERYGLTSQIRRAAVSVPSNIAEGYGRYQSNEYRQFLRYSLGSCAELTTQLIVASKLGYLNSSDSSVLIDEIEQISKMTMSLTKKLGNAKTGI